MGYGELRAGTPCQSCNGRPFSGVFITTTPKAMQQPIDIATSNTQCASHLSALVFHRSPCINIQWQSRSYIPSILGMIIEILAKSWHPRARFRDSAEARWSHHTSTPETMESKTLKKYEGKIEYCRVGARYWLAQNMELEQDSTSVNCQIHHFSTNKSDEEVFDYGALIDRADQRDQVYQTKSPITAKSSKIRGNEQSITIPRDNLEQERWAQLTHLFGVVTHQTHACTPFSGICILSRQEHVEAPRIYA